VNARLSQHLTLLGLCSMIFYGVMLGTGKLSIEVMPHFVISAVIFLTSGRLMRKGARSQEEVDKEEEKRKKQAEVDWEWFTAMFNWTMALVVMGTLTIFLMKPLGSSFIQALKNVTPHAHYVDTTVP